MSDVTKLLLLVGFFILSVVPLVYLQLRRDTLIAVLRLMSDGRSRTAFDVTREVGIRITECRASLHLITLEERGLVYSFHDVNMLRYYRITGDGRREVSDREIGDEGGFDGV